MSRANAPHVGGIALALFALYAATAPRTVALEDDGFFILASYFAGVAHPPGYPVFTFLGKLFTLLPFGSVAYRVHLLSALFGAASAAMLWLCARRLGASRGAAWLAALALGLSPAFWSQAIIADVYTLNTFFFFVLLFMALAPAPRLGAMALVFGLSLANHWPLMLLVSPALAVLAWPQRQEALRRLPALVFLMLAGLAPYAWMVWRSWYSPVAFYGPIDYLHELWFYVSRQGYAQTDVSATATWLDRVQFLGFAGRELLLQFAVAGTLLAAFGFALQWRAWGTRVGAALAIAFAMPAFALLFLLGFDYDALQKHVFHVYPLPAYGVAALWLALGAGSLAARRGWSRAQRAGAGAALVALVGAVGAYGNLRAGYDWTARYAAAVLDSLPPDASIVLSADSDIGPIAYFHLVEQRRPDLTLYQEQGLILGNRLVHPMRSPGEEGTRAALRSLAEQASTPLAFIQNPPEGFGQQHRVLYVLLDKRAPERGATLEIPPPIAGFLDLSVLPKGERDPWTRLTQQKLRERYAGVLGMTLDRASPDPAAARALEALAEDYAGALGAAEGLLANPRGYSPRQVAQYLEKARDLMPADAPKERRARFFELRGYVRLGQGDAARAREDLEASMATWPSPDNRAGRALEDLRARERR